MQGVTGRQPNGQSPAFRRDQFTEALFDSGLAATCADAALGPANAVFVALARQASTHAWRVPSRSPPAFRLHFAGFRHHTESRPAISPATALPPRTPPP